MIPVDAFLLQFLLFFGKPCREMAREERRARGTACVTGYACGVSYCVPIPRHGTAGVSGLGGCHATSVNASRPHTAPGGDAFCLLLCVKLYQICIYGRFILWN